MMIGIAVLFFAFGWHLSGTYHQRRWARDIAKQAEALAWGVYRVSKLCEPLHADQDAIEMSPAPPSIKAICLDAYLGERHKLRWRA